MHKFWHCLYLLRKLPATISALLIMCSLHILVTCLRIMRLIFRHLAEALTKNCPF